MMWRNYVISTSQKRKIYFTSGLNIWHFSAHISEVSEIAAAMEWE
jgi:hypothetical protein